MLTALMLSIGFFVAGQGTETFSNISSSATAYTTVTWTGDNGLLWESTDTRTDQSITGKAVGLRNSTVSVNGVPNGIQNLQFSYKYIFSGSAGNLVVKINGVQVGSVAVPTSQTTPATASFNNINVTGSFDLQIQQTATGQRVAIDDIAWTGYSGIPCTAPTAQPTGLTFSSITNNSINGAFNASTPAADEYLVIRSTSSSLTVLPQNGTTYAEGEIIGNGTVVTSGSAINFSDPSLAAGTTYYYFIFAANTVCTGAPAYNTNAPLSASVTTTAPPVCAAPASAPGAISSTAASTSVNGSFVAAQNADGYLVIRSNSGSFSFTPANGTNYSAGDVVGSGTTGTVIKYDVGNTFGATNLTPNTTYYFYVYAVNNFNCSGGPQYFATPSTAAVSTTNNSTGEPAGYYSSATGLSCAPLKSALSNIITTGHSPQSYDALWSQYKVTDIKPREVGSGSANVIWDIYSDIPGPANDPYNYTPGTDQCGNYNSENDCYNREHSFPKSWFDDVMPAFSDINHIFPTDGYVNGKRSNYRYGEVASATFTSLNGSKLGSSATAGINGTVFEPRDDYKGDVARAFLYMVTRYESNIPTWATYNTDGRLAMQANTYPSVNVNYLKLMIKWHNEDPVSAKEITRNNGTYSFQGNRNPYIDRPEYVDQVWNANCTGLSALPVQIVYFGGKLNGAVVQLEWQVENEINFNLYEIEKSVNGVSFKKMGEVKGNNSSRYSYSDNVDANRGQRVYYRLKKIDRDGSYSFSEVFSIHIPTNNRFSVYPNPASTYMQLQLNGNIAGDVTIRITDAMGKMVQQHNMKATAGNIRLSTDQLQNGTYLVIMYHNGEQFFQKVVVSK